MTSPAVQLTITTHRLDDVHAATTVEATPPQDAAGLALILSSALASVLSQTDDPAAHVGALTVLRDALVPGGDA